MIKAKILREDPKSKIIVVTPLWEGHKISRETKVSIKRNKYPFTWVSAEGRNNIPTNAFGGLDWYLTKRGKCPDYYIMIDRDVDMGRHMLDRLYDKLSKAPHNIAYAYASFKFQGAVNQEFPAVQWDINKLLLHNYISSNSMFKTNAIYEVGLVTDEKYKRLLDWAFLLKLFLERGYMGIPCPDANFVAQSSPSSISAGTPQDYDAKRRLIIEDFCKPILEKYAPKPTKPTPQPEQTQTTTMEF
jgi:hypothetical protein